MPIESVLIDSVFSLLCFSSVVTLMNFAGHELEVGRKQCCRDNHQVCCWTLSPTPLAVHTTQTPSIACNVWVAFWSNSSYSYITVVSFKLTHFSAGLVFQDALNCRDCYVLFVSKLSLICAPCRLCVVMRPRFDFWFWHYIYCLFVYYLQCFDTVGWAAGRASRL